MQFYLHYQDLQDHSGNSKVVNKSRGIKTFWIRFLTGLFCK